ncbi:MAG TPA: hypothetical protein PK397_07570 [Ignavibacteriaceae bacterium]|jgi:hypothetical protein|nr:hypothetical protein [Ignavibacteriaceae bacterium]
MAAKLISYYKKAKELGGIKAEMRLAIITKIPSAKAEVAPDTPENIRLFENALAEIQKEYHK